MPPTTASLPSPASPPDRRVPWALTAWVTVALGISASGVLKDALLRVRPLAPLLIWGSVAAVLLLAARWAPLRAWARTVDLRVPILFHVVRVAFGLAFLVLGAEGQLSATFAGRAGPGDVLAGLLALPAALVASRLTPLRRQLVLGWNTLALADILLVNATAVSILLSPSAHELARIGTFPFSLLPLLVVPLVLLTHVLVFVRLWKAPTPVKSS